MMCFVFHSVFLLLHSNDWHTFCVVATFKGKIRYEMFVFILNAVAISLSILIIIPCTLRIARHSFTLANSSIFSRFYDCVFVHTQSNQAFHASFVSSEQYR